MGTEPTRPTSARSPSFPSRPGSILTCMSRARIAVPGLAARHSGSAPLGAEDAVLGASEQCLPAGGRWDAPGVFSGVARRKGQR